ncbi:hypothetical protein T484DRAFT_3072180 [Baffinella frigidus]|nr:hypothetical protein T484DRAFT_3072180 [Cryptophyta sp. CCMP2293]
MTEGDQWLVLLRKFLRESEARWDPETGTLEKDPPEWSKILEADPMPDSIEQYFELTLRQRALILWACCEHLVEADEAERVDAFPNVDWEDADAFRMTPRCHDARNNAYWYFDGSDGVLYREGTPAPSSAGRPTFEALSRGYEELAEVGKKLMTEGRKHKKPELLEFAQWLVEEEAPKLLSKAQAAERAKSKQAMFELMPRKRSSRIVDKEVHHEQRVKEEAESAARKSEDDARRRADSEKRRKEKERDERLREREAMDEKSRKDEELLKQLLEADRERRCDALHPEP